MGLPSGLDQFDHYVARTDFILHATIERHLPLEGEWWNIEEMLQYFDAESAMEEAAEYLVGYGADDWSDDNHHVVQREAERIAAAMSDDLRAALARWVTTLDAHPIPSMAFMLLPPGTRYLNFNYTRTLQRAFRVSDTDVLHIHGQGRRGDPLVLGHARPVSDPKPMSAYGGEDDDVRITEAAQILDETLNRAAKRSGGIIDANGDWFRSLSSTTTVRVMGHSLAEVDHPYFEEIARHVRPDAVWNVSCHSADDRVRSAELRDALCIEPDRWHVFNLTHWIAH